MIRGQMIIMLVSLALFCSCKRDHLYYASSNTATVLLDLDWSKSGVNPNGVSVFAFNEADGSLYRRFPPVSVKQDCYIKLPEGDYTLVVINDTPEEFGGRIEFSGEEKLNTFIAKGVKDEVRSKKLEEHLQSKATGAEYCIVEPDSLAVSVLRGVHISPEQIDYYYDIPGSDINAESAVEIPVQPKPVISSVSIKAHVTGLKYARGTTVSFLRGVAEGYCFDSQENSQESVAQSFILNNRKFDEGSDSDGTITAEFLSFGLLGDGNTGSRYYLDINFVLINGEAHPLTFDVTDLISVDVSLSLQLSLKMDLEIVLPEVVGEEGDGGFSTDVVEWDDEIVDIPM